MIVLLACGHSRLISDPLVALAPGSQMMCTRRRDHSVQTIIEVKAEWRIVCVDCNVRRSYGMSEHHASLGASHHQNKYPTHTVQIKQGNVTRFVRKSRNIPLPLDEPPPF